MKRPPTPEEELKLIGMPMRIIAIFILLTIAAGAAFGQNVQCPIFPVPMPAGCISLPDKPEPRFGTVRIELVDKNPPRRWMQEMPVPHKTADKAWWTWTLVSAALTIADMEYTAHNLKDPNVRELNPVYGSHPSRLRLYGISGAFFGVSTYFSWRYKREDDAVRAYGARVGWAKWWIAPAANTASHAFGVIFSAVATRQ